MKPKATISKTMSGAGIFLRSIKTVIIKTNPFTQDTPCFINNTMPEDRINPAAIAVMPFKATLIPLISLKSTQIG